MKIFFSICLLAFPMFLSTAIALENDPTVQVGTLENGLTYFIKENHFPENRAAIRLVVKAGSIHEEENQRGLAHFLEHMVFRGTENFADNQIIEYLESIGAQFGPDLNAYTSFDHTCYMLNLPMNKDELKQGISILSDFAMRAKIDEDAYNKERHVVYDEYNMRTRGAQWRSTMKMFETIFPNSRILERFPIGLEEVILNSEVERVREFYTKWYRPDRMFVVVVGDFESAEVVKMIETHFGTLPKVEAEIEEVDMTLNLAGDLERTVMVDDELPANNLMCCSFYRDSVRQVGFDTLKESVFKVIWQNAFGNRCNRLKDATPSPFLYVQAVNKQQLMNDVFFNMLSFGSYEDRPLKPLEVIFKEYSNYQKHGISADEFEKAKLEAAQALQNGLSNLDKIESAAFAQDLVAFVVNGSPYPSVKDQFELEQQVWAEITLAEFNAWLSEQDLLSNFHVMAFSPKEGVYTVEAIDAEVAKVSSIEADETVEKKVHKTLETKTSEQPVVELALVDTNEFGFSEYTLANDMKVIMHPTKHKQNQMFVCLSSIGGKNLFSEEEYGSADFALTYLIKSGIANLDGVEMNEVLSKENIGVNLSLGSHERTLFLTSMSDDKDTLFQVLAAFFNERRQSSKTWENIIEQHVENKKTQMNMPAAKFWKVVNDELTAKHPLFQDPDVEQCSEQTAIACLNRIFADPSEYTMVVVGDFDQEKVLRSLERHVSTVPIREEVEHTYEPPKGVYKVDTSHFDVFEGKDVGHQKILFWPFNDLQIDMHSERLTLTAFEHCLKHRILEEIRIKMGETYGILFNVIFPMTPYLQEGSSRVIVTCLPELSDKIEAEIVRVVGEFLANGATDEELSSAKEIIKKNLEDERQYNGGILKMHNQAIRWGFDLSKNHDIYKWIDEQVTKEGVDLLAKRVLENRPLVSFDHFPAKE